MHCVTADRVRERISARARTFDELARAGAITALAVVLVVSSAIEGQWLYAGTALLFGATGGIWLLTVLAKRRNDRASP